MSISYLSVAQNLSEVFVKILKSRSFGRETFAQSAVCGSSVFFFICEMVIPFVHINQSSAFQTVVRGMSLGGTQQI